MKRWFTRSLVLCSVALLVMGLVPAAAAADENFGSVYVSGTWEVACGSETYLGIPVGWLRTELADRIPPGFYLIDTVYIYSAQYGVLVDYSNRLDYVDFSYDGFNWYDPVPADGYTTITTTVYDNGGGIVSMASLTADCTTGEILIGNGSVYGPKVPTSFVQRSLSCSSAVLDAPGGKPVGDNAVYAGQSWYVNPTPVAGLDGVNYTEIFVGGYTTGYIPTACIG